MIKNQRKVLKVKGTIEVGVPAIIFADVNGEMRWQRTSPVVSWSLTVWGDFKLTTKNSIYYGYNIEFID